MKINLWRKSETHQKDFTKTCENLCFRNVKRKKMHENYCVIICRNSKNSELLSKIMMSLYDPVLTEESAAQKLSTKHKNQALTKMRYDRNTVRPSRYFIK